MKTGTILIMAGGTGGHVFPGLAVADYLRQLGWHIVWLGTQAGMEQKLVPARGYETEVISFSGLRGKQWTTWLILPLRLLKAFLQSIRILRRVKPDVVLGMGGYPAFPGGLMASLLNRPLIIHEQNALPGLTNKVLAQLADKVMLGFPGALGSAAGKTVFSGNPVRADITRVPLPQQRFQGREGRLKLLVVGGSLGAQILNTTVPLALRSIPAELRPQVVHQTGVAHVQTVQKTYADLGVTGEIMAFVEDMAKQYAECDLVVCRAGALTIAEISAAGVASILVPYPYAVDDHQTSNARFLADQGAALLIPQSELNPEKLVQWLTTLTREKLLDMAGKARSLAKPEATRVVAEACIGLSGVAHEA